MNDLEILLQQRQLVIENLEMIDFHVAAEKLRIKAALAMIVIANPEDHGIYPSSCKKCGKRGTYCGVEECPNW